MIRPARPEDRDALYRICLATGAAGADATGDYDDPDLLGHVYVGPYLALAAEHAWVVSTPDAPDVPAGYVLGAADSREFARACEQRWWPALRARYPRRADRRPSDQQLVALIHSPVPPPADLLADYPAHLHIDLLPVLQGRGVADALLRRLFESLREAGARGVHLGVDPANPRALAFYRRMGMRVLREEPGVILMGCSLGDASLTHPGRDS